MPIHIPSYGPDETLPNISPDNLIEIPDGFLIVHDGVLKRKLADAWVPVPPQVTSPSGVIFGLGIKDDGTLVTTPAPPTDVVASFSSTTQASIAFTPPTITGGSPILDYRVEAHPPGQWGTPVGASSPIIIGGLNTIGATHTFTVRARNAVGESDQSAESAPYVVT